MGVQLIEELKYVCDRGGCDAEDAFATESAANEHGWTIVNFRGQQSVLCPIDTEKTRRFLQGDMTPASMRFNADEGLRWKSSCG